LRGQEDVDHLAIGLNDLAKGLAVFGEEDRVALATATAALAAASTLSGLAGLSGLTTTAPVLSRSAAFRRATFGTTFVGAFVVATLITAVVAATIPTSVSTSVSSVASFSGSGGLGGIVRVLFTHASSSAWPTHGGSQSFLFSLWGRVLTAGYSSGLQKLQRVPTTRALNRSGTLLSKSPNEPANGVVAAAP
jgi:hypothetical protein